MNRFPKCRWALAFLLFAYLPMDAQVLGDLIVALIRVSFPPGDYPGFTGNGNYEYVQNEVCGDYTIDPAPHDKNYFQSHLEAVNNYFRKVSYGKFGIDLHNSTVFPMENESSYLINKPMNYYHEISHDEVHEKRITELLRDAVNKAFEVDNIAFSKYDLVIVVHPGVGQDFKLPFLDPTPEDIPSTYVDNNMVNTHLGGPIQVGRMFVPHGIIVPETQNHLFYDESIFSQLSSPCDVQYSLTGTLTMMIGFAIGLPPLWDLETGQSGVAVFSLMDQGSNNGRGIIPAPPDAWTRIFAGWEEATTFQYPGKISIQSDMQNSIAKVPISADEYFLIENRNNWFRNGVSIDSARYAVWEKANEHPPFINVMIDSVRVGKDENGVITDIPNYDLGLPASGLLIWHIDEQKIRGGINSFLINADRKHRGIDLEEADGAQDIGYVSNLLTDPSSGYWGDMWFTENKEYFRANAEGSMDFSSFTYPNTKSNSGANSGIHISNISKAGKIMTFNFSSSYDVAYLKDENKSILFQWDVDGDGDLDFVGEGDSLWWGDDLNEVNAFNKNDGENLQVCIVQNSNPTAIAIAKRMGTEQIFEWFEYDPSNKKLFLKWKNKKETVNIFNLFKAEADEERIIIQDGTSFYQVKNENISSIDPNEELFPLTVFDGSWTFQNDQYFSYEKFPILTIRGIESHFENVSLLDLENDGHAEIVVVDHEGNIHALSEGSIYKNGFPISAMAVGPVLGMDLLDDRKRELIYQHQDGTIRILDFEGAELERIATSGSLKGLSNYNDKHVILTGNNLISFKENWDGAVNEWAYPNGTADRSSLLLTGDYTPLIPFLLDQEQSYAYPNPSYGEDVIFRIHVGEAKTININIFDLAGFPVETLKKETIISQPTGSNSRFYILRNSIEIPWSVSNINSGLYFARVVVKLGGQSEEKIIKVGVIK